MLEGRSEDVDVRFEGCLLVMGGFEILLRVREGHMELAMHDLACRLLLTVQLPVVRTRRHLRSPAAAARSIVTFSAVK